MKAKPFSFEEIRVKGVFDSTPSSSSESFLQFSQAPLRKWGRTQEKNCYVGTEPTSVLDSKGSPSPPASTSTLSSSLGGGSAVSAAALAAEILENPPALEKCGVAMEELEMKFSASSGQEQSISSLIMGDIDDPSFGLNKFIRDGNNSQQDLEFPANFSFMDQGFVFDSINAAPDLVNGRSDFIFHGQNPMLTVSATNLLPFSHTSSVFQTQPEQQFVGILDDKPQVFDTRMAINLNQSQFMQNQSMFMPLPCSQLQELHLSLPPAKRLNFQIPKASFSGSDEELFLRQQYHQQAQLLPLDLRKKPTMANQQLQQSVIDQLFKVAELIENGEQIMSEGILARLNHQVSPIGKPFQRAAYYFMEAFKSYLSINTPSSSNLSPSTLLFKIGAYKSFSEISPVLQFANFTSNQVLLEALAQYDRIHIIDFEIGYGGQWASFLQELAMRNGGAPYFKLTAIVFPSPPPSTIVDLELSFTKENLKRFAGDLNIVFELEFVTLESIISGSWSLPSGLENESIAVNLPISLFSNHPSSLPLILRVVKQVSPTIMVSLDRTCDGTDFSFAHHIVNSLHYYSGLLESLDSTSENSEALQKIEKYLLQPGIEKLVLGRLSSPERTLPWRNLFLTSGISPISCSNFAESQAECLVHPTPARSFHIERKHASLVLCWQQKELVGVSAWRC